MAESRRLIVYGISGAGRRLLDIAIDMLDGSDTVPFDRIAAVDDAPTDDNLERLASAGIPYIGTSDVWASMNERAHFSIGIGDSEVRRRLATGLAAAGHTPINLIAPTARISRTATLGQGCVVSPGVDVSANAVVGDFTHIMANAAISHDTTIGSFANINPGAVLSGNCTVGEQATIGAGAVVIQGLTVGAGALVGAAACVTRDVLPSAVVKGVPAR